MMNLIVADDGIPTIDLRPGSVGQMAPTDAYVEEAACALADKGCIRLLHAFAPDQIAALKHEHDRRHARYFAQQSFIDARDQGDRRTLITLEISGAFNTPTFYANDRVYPVVARVLGDAFILGHMAVILSRSGAADQFVHRDAPSLFGDGTYDAFMPAVGIAVVLPLVALDGINGGTRVWPGTHRVASDEEARAMPSMVAEIPLGGCLLFDVRLMHGGKGNRSANMRSIVYGAYHRKWFRDWDGFDKQSPMSISRRELANIPAGYRHLFDWRFDSYASWRRKDFADRILNHLPSTLADYGRRLIRRND